MEEPLLFNLQRFSVHDGDGIRTTLFFKGCHLSCLWCHNPESQRFVKDLFYYKQRCTGCGLCIDVCKVKCIQRIQNKMSIDRSLCTLCGLCTERCSYDALEIVGKPYSITELIDFVKKDLTLMDESCGGVTLSGGEVMLQNTSYLVELCKGLKKWGIHIAVDTCGSAPFENFERIMPYVDTFLYDLKTLNPTTFKKYIGEDFSLVLENLKHLNHHHQDIRLRIPLIKDINTSEEAILEIISFLKTNDIVPKRIDLLPYHSMGLSKYGYLSKDTKNHIYEPPGKIQVDDIYNLFFENGYKNLKIGG